jgi:hypothetical protein
MVKPLLCLRTYATFIIRAFFFPQSAEGNSKVSSDKHSLLLHTSAHPPGFLQHFSDGIHDSVPMRGDCAFCGVLSSAMLTRILIKYLSVYLYGSALQREQKSKGTRVTVSFSLTPDLHS